ncbi:hypothetical protein V565_140280 [Rhizoctonia solani 123E]|uniref:Uncharacterized protein n=1 Tax=Rhizoctonia solani 123E TaxID=1423351 RepID=A0A074RLC6_9AGAM|nr:hypothetical protein V565_140280 [Rhizoctonia solani 123E]
MKMDLILHAHPRWGPLLTQYPNSYTNDALLARLTTPIGVKRRATIRMMALRTIRDICLLSGPTLGTSEYSNIVECITLGRLKSILELTRFPSEYENLALPNLVAGCIELLSSVMPSPFAYEYGYLCFRTLVFALNACLLKYGEVWDETIERIRKAPPRIRLPIFWDQSASLLCDDIVHMHGQLSVEFFDSIRSRRWSIPHFDQRKLDKLLYILHLDQKNFLIALRDTGSMGLSTLMFVLKVHIENKRPTMNKADYMKKAYFPFCRVFFRYQVVVPNFGMEPSASMLVYSPGMNTLEDEKFLDLDDSINFIQAYIDSVNSSRKRGNHHLKLANLVPLAFVASYAVAGCEHLAPAMFKATMEIF